MSGELEGPCLLLLCNLPESYTKNIGFELMGFNILKGYLGLNQGQLTFGSEGNDGRGLEFGAVADPPMGMQYEEPLVEGHLLLALLLDEAVAELLVVEVLLVDVVAEELLHLFARLAEGIRPIRFIS